MKLEIKNFRSIVKKTIEIPDNGVVHISGDSEAGKTTLLDSIVWSLYGTDGTSNVTPLSGGKKTEIRFSFKDMEIKRTKSPNSVECNGMMDESAQGFIDTKIANVSHFKLGSYVQQKMKNCFLNLKPREQLEFLDKLAFDIDINKIKQRLRDKEKEYKEKHNLINERISALSEQEKNILNDLEQYLVIHPVDDPSLEIKENSDKIRNINQEHDEVFSVIQKLVDEKNNPARNYDEKISNLKIQKDGLLEELNNVDKKINESNNQVSDNDLQEIKEKILHHTQEKKSIEKAIEHASDINNRKVKLPMEFRVELIPSYQQKLSDLKARLQKGQSQLWEMEQQLLNSNNTLVCPHCEGKTKYTNGLLIKDETKINIDELQTQIKKFSDGIIKVKNMISSYQQMVDFSDTYEEYDVSTLCIDLENTVNMLSQLEQQRDGMIHKKAVLSQFINQKYNIELKLQALELELSGISTDQDFRPIAVIDKEIHVHENTRSKCKDLIKELELKNNELENLREQYNAFQNKIHVKKQLESQLGQINKNIIDTEKSMVIIQSELSKIEKLKKIVNRSQLDALKSVTDSINAAAQTYLDYFFPNCGTSIRILPHKVNQDGSISDKIGIEIVHNGIQYKSINEFSGGAENRAILAFQLAISDLVSSPILLLDEPLVGVHEELRDDIYNCIKEIASEKLIIVVEHGAKENLFDYVLKI